MQGWDYKTYWEGENLIRRFSFDSLEDYLSYLESAPIQDAFEGGVASELGTGEFTGSRDFEHAIELARFGWHDGFSELVRLTDKVKRSLDYSPEVHSTFHYYVGFAPDVKAFMEGSPLSMINAPVVRKPHINVYMNTSIDGFVDESDIYMRGAAVLALCEVVEACGIMVDLHLFEMSFIDKDVMVSEFNLKAQDERINLAKLHFPICHPSWVRRLNFRLIETMPNVTQAWAGSYGIPAERKMIESVLGIREHDVLVPSLQEISKKANGHGSLDGCGNSKGNEGLDGYAAPKEHLGILDVARCVADVFNIALPADKMLKFKGFPIGSAEMQGG